MRSVVIAAAAAAAIGLAGLVAACTPVQIIADAVQLYCGKPESARLALREAVAAAIAPNRIEIHCNLPEATP